LESEDLVSESSFSYNNTVTLFSSMLSYAQVALGLVVVVIVIYRYSRYKWRTEFPEKAPKLCSENNIITGPWRFWSDRWEFFRCCISRSSTGNFSFYLGKNRVVGLSGDESRKWFFESKDLHLNQGYSMMLGPSSDQLEQGHTVERLLGTRIANLLRGENIIKSRSLSSNISISSHTSSSSKSRQRYQNIAREVWEPAMEDGEFV